MEVKPGDVLTIEELAAYLKIPKSTLYKIGWHWRFRKGAIDHWLDETWTNKHGSCADR